MHLGWVLSEAHRGDGAVHRQDKHAQIEQGDEVVKERQLRDQWGGKKRLLFQVGRRAAVPGHACMEKWHAKFNEKL